MSGNLTYSIEGEEYDFTYIVETNKRYFEQYKGTVDPKGKFSYAPNSMADDKSVEVFMMWTDSRGPRLDDVKHWIRRHGRSIRW